MEGNEKMYLLKSLGQAEHVKRPSNMMLLQTPVYYGYIHNHVKAHIVYMNAECV